MCGHIILILYNVKYFYKIKRRNLYYFSIITYMQRVLVVRIVLHLEMCKIEYLGIYLILILIEKLKKI